MHACMCECVLLLSDNGWWELPFSGRGQNDDVRLLFFTFNDDDDDDDDNTLHPISFTQTN